MRKLRFGMIGGGPGAFIGAVHRRAAQFDGLAELVAGAFSRDPEKSVAQGQELGLDPARVYPSMEALIDTEANRIEDRLDFIAIVTPNDAHFAAAKAALEAGFHVACDKPITTTYDDACRLVEITNQTGHVFLLTHNYAGYPMIKQARHLVASGELGTIRKIVVEYPQGWLAERIEASGQKQASWRTDPSRSGPAGALGDIGTHAEHLVRYVTGLEMEELFADMAAMVDGRALDDDSNILIHYEGGARGILYASQVSQGEENALSLRVYGTKAGLEWKQEHPNHLTVRANDAPIRVYSRGHGPLCEAAAHATRLPSGHPEGYPDAFANIYANAIRVMAARLSGITADPLDHDFPSPEDGARGIHFINCALESATTRSWVNARYNGPTMAS